MFKPSEVANEDLKEGDVEQNVDYMIGLPSSPFVQVLQSAVESKNCKFILFLSRYKSCYKYLLRKKETIIIFLNSFSSINSKNIN